MHITSSSNKSDKIHSCVQNSLGCSVRRAFFQTWGLHWMWDAMETKTGTAWPPWAAHSERKSQGKPHDLGTKPTKKGALGAFSVVMTFTNPRFLSLWESYFVTCREWMYSRWQWLEWIFLQNATRYLVMIFSYFLFLWCQNLLTF